MRFHSFTWLDSRLSSTREYRLNDHFFSRLGFTKQTDGDASIYRYSNPLTTNNIIEVVYQPEFDVLSIGEFWIGTLGELTGNNLLGQFRIESDEDLAFIFLKNVRLHHLFYNTRKRV